MFVDTASSASFQVEVELTDNNTGAPMVLFKWP